MLQNYHHLLYDVDGDFLLQHMLLADFEIQDLCSGSNPMIAPFQSTRIKPHEQLSISYGLSSVGYDIRLSPVDVKIFKRLPGQVIDPKRSSFEHLDNAAIAYDVIPPSVSGLTHPLTESYFILPGHSYALATTIERFHMPDYVTAICLGKSTYARWGVIVNVTPLECGWRGHITVEISNSSPSDVKIYLEEGIAQLLFLEHNEPRHTYGARSGKYQDQPQRIVLGKV